MIRLGPNCRLLGIRPELSVANLVLLGILQKYDAVMILVHAVDGSHSRASLHYAGAAEDLVFAMSMDKGIKAQIVREWSDSAGQDFDIFIEDAGTANEHVHCEYQPKNPY